MKTTLIALTLLTLSTVATAASANTQNQVPVENYTYATHLDIAKVTHTPDMDFCGVKPVQLGYIDHAGQSHNLRYQVVGNGCDSDN